MQRLSICGRTVKVFVVFILISFQATGQVKTDSLILINYYKKERNTGLNLSVTSEREELRTDISRNYEDNTAGTIGFLFSGQKHLFLPSKQEQTGFRFLIGPLFGKGSLIDSTAAEVMDVTQKLAGLRSYLHASSTNRFYFDRKNYTLVHLDAWARYDYYRHYTDGTVTDSLHVTFPYNSDEEKGKFRYGFNARAGWGIGRIQPVNHYMAAAWLLEKYYPRRNFSDAEIMQVAKEIGRIKHQRNLRTGLAPEKEAEQLENFLNKQLYLVIPDGIERDWQLSEFRPRYHGSRLEFGPFFNYFNQEPDFVSGGFIQFENENFCNLKWNRKLGAKISYNSYKHHDWMLLETVLGWNWYPSLNKEVGFGLRYLPGVMISNDMDFGPVRHNFMPFLEYFSQLNSRYRIETKLAWRIAPNDQFLLPGPEMSVSFYRSNY